MSNAINYQAQGGVSLTQNLTDSNYRQLDPFVSLTSPNLNLPFPSSEYIRLQPRKVNFQPNTLGNTTHVYSSPVLADVIHLAQFFADFQCAYEIQEGPLYTITVQAPWDTISNEDFTIAEFASEQWEIVPNTDTKSLIYSGLIIDPFAPPTVNGNYAVLPDTYKVLVQQALENKYQYITTPPSGSAIPSASFIPLAQQILGYLRFGVEGVPSYTQTLKRTAVIDTRNSNRAFQTPADNINSEFNANGTVNYILSTSDLCNKYGVPNTVEENLLPSYRKQVSTVYDPTPRFVYAGWLVRPPTRQFVTRNKVQLTQEFVWNELLGGLYYIPSPSGNFPLVYSPASNPNGFGS